MKATQTILAFDYGTASIGVAAAQSLLNNCASELRPIRARDGIPNWEEIRSLIDEWQPNICLVGLPLNMDDSESDFAARARKFANRLHGRFGVQVELVDERLSTAEAKEEAFERGHKGNFKKVPIDSIAARLILEGWLHSNRQPKR